MRGQDNRSRHGKSLRRARVRRTSPELGAGRRASRAERADKINKFSATARQEARGKGEGRQARGTGREGRFDKSASGFGSVPKRASRLAADTRLPALGRRGMAGSAAVVALYAFIAAEPSWAAGSTSTTIYYNYNFASYPSSCDADGKYGRAPPACRSTSRFF